MKHISHSDVGGADVAAADVDLVVLFEEVVEDTALFEVLAENK